MSVESVQLGYNSEDSRAEEVEGGPEVMSVAQYLQVLVMANERTNRLKCRPCSFAKVLHSL